MTKRGYVSTDSPTVSRMFHAAPRPSSGSPRRASFPRGKLLYRAFGWYHSTARVVFVTWLGDESSPLHCVIPFIHTGCICNVAGGRLPPLHTRRWVIPFIRTGCICNVAGGRLPPLHTRRWVIPFIRTGCICNVADGRLPPLRLLRLAAPALYWARRLR